ncbi:hypothetical protein GCM10027082_20320 [Comamonas humi]
MMAADSLHAGVHLVLLSGVSFCWPSPCGRARSADALALHFALHLWLHSMQPSNVQASCLERGRPAAIAVFAGALAAGAAAPLGRNCRERMREANAEGKIEGRGTVVCAKPVCTWVWGDTRHKAAACCQRPQCVAGMGNTVCHIRLGAMGLVGVSS